MTKQELLAAAKPILFNTDMVRAILDGRKTVTRRVIKPRYKDDEHGFQILTNAHTGEFVRVEKVDENECGIFADGTERYIYPRYQVGDFLYVRETWGTYEDQWMDAYYFVYRADYPNGATQYLYSGIGCDEDETIYCDLPKWRPSIHMPKVAARIFLRVTDVRAERLQEINTIGIRAEGVYECFMCGNENCETKPLDKVLCGGTFKDLWDSTIKKTDLDTYGWDANPFVWVYEFERMICDETDN